MRLVSAIINGCCEISCSIFRSGSRVTFCSKSLTSVNIAKKSSNPNLCVGEMNTDQQRRKTAKVAKVSITVQSAIKSGCLLASRLLTSIANTIDGIFRRGDECGKKMEILGAEAKEHSKVPSVL